MRIDWMKTEEAKERLDPLVDLTGAVEGVVCLMAPEMTQADGGPTIRLCWWDKATGRCIDSYTGTAYNAADIRGWALAWADVRTLMPVDEDGLVVPIIDCTHKDANDGTCAHPRNMTPECHVNACPRLALALCDAMKIKRDL
jgi:hypothetical protein